MALSRAWNVSVYGGDRGEGGGGGTRGHICPHQARSGVDVYQWRSRRLAGVVHRSCWFPLTGPGSVSPRHYLQ